MVDLYPEDVRVVTFDPEGGRSLRRPGVLFDRCLEIEARGFAPDPKYVVHIPMTDANPVFRRLKAILRGARAEILDLLRDMFPVL